MSLLFLLLEQLLLATQLILGVATLANFAQLVDALVADHLEGFGFDLARLDARFVRGPDEHLGGTRLRVNFGVFLAQVFLVLERENALGII